MSDINALSIAHRFISGRVHPGNLCIDATAGRGRDTALLCRLAGETGSVIALDIQQEALDSTAALLEKEGLSAKLVRDSHANLARYAQPGTVDCIVFNFGWLPGGDHTIVTQTQSSIEALRQGCSLLRQGGAMSLCIYYGRNNGYGERDAILEYLATLDPKAFTVVACTFPNRGGDPAFPVFVVKQG